MHYADTIKAAENILAVVEKYISFLGDRTVLHSMIRLVA